MSVAEGRSFNHINRRWNALSLAHQFVLAGGGVLIVGMLVLGVWVTGQIQSGVTRNTAAATALYVDSVISPLLPDIRNQQVLSAGARRALDETLSQGALGERIASFKIWLQGGLIAYSSEQKLIGQTFPLTESLKSAWAGDVAAEFDELDDEENITERGSEVPLLEIYSPIREPWSGRVVAVAEFYERAGELTDSLRVIRMKSWLVVATVALCMMGLLWGIVLRGNSLIESQRSALEERVSELSRLLTQNQELRNGYNAHREGQSPSMRSSCGV